MEHMTHWSTLCTYDEILIDGQLIEWTILIIGIKINIAKFVFLKKW